MNRYIKPNLHLPVSLHDARVTGICLHRGESCNQGVLHLVFDAGFTAKKEEEWCQTGKAQVKLQGIDWDFSSVRYFEESSWQEVSFEDLKKNLESSEFEIIDESYGYNRSVFSGWCFEKERIRQMEMEIYHFSETEYTWQDCPAE